MAKSKSSGPESRRHFLKLSLRRLAKAGFEAAETVSDLPRALRKSAEPPRPAPPPPKPIHPPTPLWLNQNVRMAYSRLGRTNFMMSRIGMGCGSIRHANVNVVLEAVDHGINFLDTAYNYGDSETALATILPGIRHKVWLCTKTPPLGSSRDTGASSPMYGCPELIFWESLESSLARLDVDFVDCYILQAVDDPELLRDEALHEAIRRAKEQGKIGYIGVSTHRNVDQVFEEILGLDLYDLIMAPINPMNLSAMEPLLKEARENDLGVIGFRHATGIAEPAPTASPHLFELPEDLDPAQLALLYMLKNGSHAGSLISFESNEQIEKMAPLAVFDSGVNASNEIDSVVDLELWPICSVCGQQRSLNTDNLETYYRHHYRTRYDVRGEGDIGGEESEEAAGHGEGDGDPDDLLRICVKCAAERKLKREAGSPDENPFGDAEDPP